VCYITITMPPPPSSSSSLLYSNFLKMSKLHFHFIALIHLSVNIQQKQQQQHEKMHKQFEQTMNIFKTL
jgi:hypothetical protein